MTPDTRYGIKCRTTEAGEEKCLVVLDGKEVAPAEELSRDDAQALADKLNRKLLHKLMNEAREKVEEAQEHLEKLREEYHALMATIEAKTRDSGRGSV